MYLSLIWQKTTCNNLGWVIRTFLWPGICGERTGGDTWRSGRELPTEYSPHKSETNLSNQQQYNTSQEKTCQIRIQQLLIGLIITERQHDIKKEFQPKTLSQIYTPPPPHFISVINLWFNTRDLDTCTGFSFAILYVGYTITLLTLTGRQYRKI